MTRWKVARSLNSNWSNRPADVSTSTTCFRALHLFPDGAAVAANFQSPNVHGETTILRRERQIRAPYTEAFANTTDLALVGHSSLTRDEYLGPGAYLWQQSQPTDCNGARAPVSDSASPSFEKTLSLGSQAECVHVAQSLFVLTSPLSEVYTEKAC
ncbi:hypothetical protein BJ322DRAFT_329496 [Thelephora terrestris]|uniref:Uncharacterized protein n=1 Tax=Thelephora terrestris TaxID=56493 RepID=A0A9P6L381_9AGAM|nr:hypothetical protein BJ322DRAFT_329496 [Thelephora terrestris]